MLCFENNNDINSLSGDQRQIALLLRDGPMGPDALVQASGLSAKRVQTALVMLNLAAKVQALPGGLFKLR